MAFPPPPVNTIDWSNIGFTVREVNGHIESHYSVKTGQWSAPKFITDPYLRLHGMAPGLNYGQQAYEGLKAFRSPANSITIFRPSRNAHRLAHSASYISVPPVPEALFLESVHAAVSLNAEFVPPHETGAAMYIRPLIFGSSARLGLSPPEEYTFCVGIRPRAPDGVGSAKVGGNYAPVLKWSDRAREEGFGITLHLDSKTRSEIDEFSTSGFIGIKAEGEDVTLVVPDSRNVIQSVTSDSCLDIARSFGWKTEIRSIKYEELPLFQEILAAGTAAALVPIKSITRNSRSETFTYLPADSEDPGPVCGKLLATLKGIQGGKIKDSFGWNTQVEQVPVGKYTDTAGETNGINGHENGTSVDALP
ncbi:hypothetical protein B7494_g3575 [Chlorociboria aeruginascens]|nr:hypothetical protein B7494_g3575 [Chlorociboria aeruginascens]